MERAAGQLSTFHHKGLVAFKFAEYKPNGLLHVVAGEQCWRLTPSLKQSRNQLPKSRKRFRLSGATCHRDQSTRLWKKYVTEGLCWSLELVVDTSNIHILDGILAFDRIIFYLAVRCRRFHWIQLQNFKLNFQTIAEKTAKNFRGLLFCRTLYIYCLYIRFVYAVEHSNFSYFRHTRK